MSDGVPTGLVALLAEEGVPLAQGPRLKGQSAWSGGNVCITDAAVPPRTLTPIHKHEHESQVVIVAAGTLAFYVEGSPVVELPAGSYSYRPAGLYHALWNPTDEPAHAYEITSPDPTQAKFNVFANGTFQFQIVPSFTGGYVGMTSLEGPHVCECVDMQVCEG